MKRSQESPTSNRSRRETARSSEWDQEHDEGRNDSANTLYGLMPILEALRAGSKHLDQITVAEGARHERLRELLERAREARVPVHRVPRSALDRSLPGVNHQGVVARTASAKYSDVDELLEQLATANNNPLVLGLDAIEDPRNLGAILRTAECAGVHAVFLPERRAAGLTATVAKTAAGALEHVSVARVTNLVQLIEQLKQRNIWVIGADEDGSAEYTEWDWTVPSALFVGSEGTGLHRLVRERCDALVRIPTYGHIESLNVSVAAGIILYEALRQRKAKTTSTDGKRKNDRRS